METASHSKSAAEEASSKDDGAALQKSAQSKNDANGDEAGAGSGFGFTTKEYETRFNRLAKQYKLPYRAHFGDSTISILSDHFALQVQVSSRHDTLSKVSFYGSTDGEAETNAHFLAYALVAMQATGHPSGKDKIRDVLISQIKQIGTDKPAESHFVSGIKYRVERVPGLGIAFSAEPT